MLGTTQSIYQNCWLYRVFSMRRVMWPPGRSKYLAVYELTSIEAVRSPEFSKRKRTPWENRMSPRVTGKNVTRIVGRQIFQAGWKNPDRGMAPALQIGRMSVPESADAEWNEWYNTEYIPGYLTVPGVIYARRYRAVDEAELRNRL